MKLYLAIHHHRHGEDYFPVVSAQKPSEAQIIPLIERWSSFEPELDETIEILGPMYPENLDSLEVLV